MENERFFRDPEELEWLVSRLRDIHLNYSELTAKHAISMDSAIQDRLHKLIYYARPETIFTKSPEKQAKFRQEILSKLSDGTHPSPVRLYPDILLGEFESVKLRSSPSATRQHLASFFLSECKHSQQLKFKHLIK